MLKSGLTEDDIILQAFHWNLTKTCGTGTIDGLDESWYKILLDKLTQIKKAGITVLYLPPPWIDRSNWSSDEGYGGGEGYFWSDFDLNSRYGTKEELIYLVEVCHKNNIRVIVDIVLNHRDYKNMTEDIWSHPGSEWNVARDNPDYNGRFEKGDFLYGDHTLNLSNPIVYNRILKALSELTHECKIDGFRWDFVFGIGIEIIKNLIRDIKNKNIISICEYWPIDESLFSEKELLEIDPFVKYFGTNSEKRIIGFAKETSLAFLDMTFKHAINMNNFAKIDSGLNLHNDYDIRSSAVTFIDNHDTGYSPNCKLGLDGQKQWPCNSENRISLYAYMLMTPGIPMIYWPDLFDFGYRNEIIDLVKTRRKLGINSTSMWVTIEKNINHIHGLIHNLSGKLLGELIISDNIEKPNADIVFPKVSIYFHKEVYE